MTKVILSILAAALTSIVLDQVMARRGWLPPQFKAAPWRRWCAIGVLGLVFWIGIFLGMALVGTQEPPEEIPIPALFQVHAMLLIALWAWYWLGFGRSVDPRARFQRQFGLKDPATVLEIALGVLAACLAWVVAIAAMAVAVGIVTASGFNEMVETGPPKAVLLIAGLPWLARLALALSAGFFEELFFRGFLQPRIGIAFSTALFVLAHASYGQPLMLVGVTVLSLIFAWLARFRQSIWAAVAAHAGFDAIQLLIVLPLATQFAGG